MAELVIEDLQGNTVLTMSGVPVIGGIDEPADYAFECIIEEEGWVEDEILKALGFSNSHINVPQQIHDDYENNNNFKNGVIEIFTGHTHTHNIRLNVIPAATVPQVTPQTEEADEYFCGEFEEMNLTTLHDKIFMVAISTGDRNKSMYIPESISGPFNFYEMVEAVANCYVDQQLHAKALITSKTFGVKPEVLNENTIDFIEARHMDIISDGLLDGGVLNSEEYTCSAGFVIEEIEKEEV